MHFGGGNLAGGPMKDTILWNPNLGETNSSGFSGLPGACRYQDGSWGYPGYQYIGKNAYWWASTEIDSANAYLRMLDVEAN